MTNIEELEKKIKMISERNRKQDEKYDNNKKEELIKAKHTTEMIVPCVMVGILFFIAGLVVGLLII